MSGSFGSSDDSADKRRQKRHALATSIDIYERAGDTKLGRLVNLHSEGLMIIGSYPFEAGKEYEVELRLPHFVELPPVIPLEVDCLWARNEDENKTFWAGCQIITTRDSDISRLNQLIKMLGE